MPLSQATVAPIGPLVSIVTPSYNQGRFIEETILSILTQDYPNIEYIVVDGASTDNTLDILKKYEGRLTWISEPDRGQSHAINKGFRMAKGDILAWLNSDDTYLPGAISKVVQHLQTNPEAMMVYGEGYLIDEQSRVERRFPYTEAFNLWKLVYLWDNILQQTAFFRRQVFDHIALLDEELNYAMDWDLWIRIGKKFRVDYIPEYLGNLREYPEAKTFSGGITRFNELVSLMRRHGNRRFPPAYVTYGLGTYDKCVFGSLPDRYPRAYLGLHDDAPLVCPLLGGVVAVGVATGQPKHALPEQLDQLVLHLSRLARIGQTGHHPLGQAQPLVERLEQERPAVRTRVGHVEGRDDRLRISLESERHLRYTVCSHRASCECVEGSHHRFYSTLQGLDGSFVSSFVNFPG